MASMFPVRRFASGLCSFVVIGFLVMSGCSKKDPEAMYRDAALLANTGRYEEAAQIWKKAAELGHRKAMSDLGALYSNGLGVSEDWEEAVTWWTKAVQAGDSEAIYSIGIYHYKQGQLNKAFLWFHEAATRGIPAAMLRVGSMHLKGEGVPADREEGLRWVRAAAKAGLPAAQTALDLHERDSQALDDSDMPYVISVDTWQRLLAHVRDGDTQAALSLFTNNSIDTACGSTAITTNSPSLAAQQLGALLQCSVGAVVSKERQPNTERLRATAVGILLQKYGLELWKPPLWTDEAGKKAEALSSNYDKAATIRHNLAKHHWATIFTSSYTNLLQAAQEHNAPIPDYYAKGL
ncbi:MAG: sel1 repeat family protein [Nitrospira sp.]|nr:sel1 repeat family protein [Nitrospira sp.]